MSHVLLVQSPSALSATQRRTSGLRDLVTYIAVITSLPPQRVTRQMKNRTSVFLGLSLAAGASMAGCKVVGVGRKNSDKMTKEKNRFSSLRRTSQNLLQVTQGSPTWRRKKAIFRRLPKVPPSSSLIKVANSVALKSAFSVETMSCCSWKRWPLPDEKLKGQTQREKRKSDAGGNELGLRQTRGHYDVMKYTTHMFLWTYVALARDTLDIRD